MRILPAVLMIFALAASQPVPAADSFMPPTSRTDGFAPPTSRQIDLVAADPSRLPLIVRGASVSEVANVVRAVLVQVVLRERSTRIRNQLIRAVIRQMYAVRPGQATALAVALGQAIASSPAASREPAVVSTIHAAVIEGAVAMEGATPAAASDLGAVFGNAYSMTLQSVGGAPAAGKSGPATPPPPPVAIPYEGQTI